MNVSLLLFGVLFGSIGLGFFIYGKRQGAPVPLLCGIALMVVPYFIDSTAALVAFGVLCSAIPYCLRR